MFVQWQRIVRAQNTAAIISGVLHLEQSNNKTDWLI